MHRLLLNNLTIYHEHVYNQRGRDSRILSAVCDNKKSIPPCPSDILQTPVRYCTLPHLHQGLNLFRQELQDDGFNIRSCKISAFFFSPPENPTLRSLSAYDSSISRTSIAFFNSFLNSQRRILLPCLCSKCTSYKIAE